MSQLKTIIYRGFIMPFLNNALLLTYIGIFLGGIGFSGLFTYTAYDYAHLGLAPVLTFFLVRLALAGFIWNPLGYFSFYKLKRKNACIMMIGFQLLAIALLANFTDVLRGASTFHLALVAGMISMVSFPFWVIFHINMIAHSSDDNVGNEVAITDICYFCGSTLAILASGLFLTFAPGPAFILICSICLFLGTLCLSLAGLKYRKCQIAQDGFNLWHAARDNKIQLFGTATEGVFQFLQSFCAPVWLWFLGLNGMMMGVLLALRGAIKFITSPLAGHLFHEGRGRDMRIGSWLKTIGWVPWVLIQAPWVIVISGFFWTMGSQLFSVGLNSRWYQGRSLAGQAVREIALSSGRIITALITVPLLYLVGIKAFFIAALILTGGTILSARLITK